MKITALTQGCNIPSRRFRWKQYERQLISAGIISDELISKYTSYPNSASNFSKLRWLALTSLDTYQRVKLSNKSELVFLQRNLISDLYTFERYISKPYIYDVDDAIFLNKFGKNCYQISQKSELTICGNEYIAEYFRKYSDIRILPTAIDTEFYRLNTNRSSNAINIGWVGTSSNYKYLYSIEKPLLYILEKYLNAYLTIVCDKPPAFTQIPKERIRYIPWSAQSELSAINEFTIGLMPIFNDAFSRGKCSYKMLSYMSVGIPVVVSDYGMNSEILKQGNVGFGCRKDDEWIDSISYLIENASKNIEIGINGSILIRREYSSEIIGTKLANIIKSINKY